MNDSLSWAEPITGYACYEPDSDTCWFMLSENNICIMDYFCHDHSGHLIIITSDYDIDKHRINPKTLGRLTAIYDSLDNVAPIYGFNPYTDSLVNAELDSGYKISKYKYTILNSTKFEIRANDIIIQLYYPPIIPTNSIDSFSMEAENRFGHSIYIQSSLDVAEHRVSLETKERIVNICLHPKRMKL